MKEECRNSEATRGLHFAFQTEHSESRVLHWLFSVSQR